MKFKPCFFFFFSSSVLICITAIAKLISSYGTGRVLQMPDPIFGIAFSKVFWIVGSIELVVAALVVLSKKLFFRAGLIAVLATSFTIYRLGLLWIGYHKPCPCLGVLTDALHIPPDTADMAMKIILAYLLIGSYATLFWLWRQRKKSAL